MAASQVCIACMKRLGKTAYHHLLPLVFAGFPDAIAQMDRMIKNLEGKLATVDKSLVVSEEEAEALGVFSPQEVEIVLEVAQHLGDNQVRVAVWRVRT